VSGFPIDSEGGCLVVRLLGKLGANDHFRFLQTAAQLAQAPCKWVILDFVGVESIEAAAYFGLNHLFQLTLTRGGNVVWANANEVIRQALQLHQLGSEVQMVNGIAEAVRGLNQRHWL